MAKPPRRCPCSNPRFISPTLHAGHPPRVACSVHHHHRTIPPCPLCSHTNSSHNRTNPLCPRCYPVFPHPIQPERIIPPCPLCSTPHSARAHNPSVPSVFPHQLQPLPHEPSVPSLFPHRLQPQPHEPSVSSVFRYQIQPSSTIPPCPLSSHITFSHSARSLRVLCVPREPHSRVGRFLHRDETMTLALRAPISAEKE